MIKQEISLDFYPTKTYNREVSMNENEIILKAMNKDTPKRTPRKFQVKLFDGTFAESKEDPLYKIVEKTKEKKKRKKYISEWSATDFIRHLAQNLSLYAIELETSSKDEVRSSLRDGTWMNQLYDKLVNKIGYEMSNYVLKEYIEWWCDTFAKTKTGQHILVSTISKDDDLNRFVAFKRHEPVKPIEESVTVPVIVETEALPMDIYKNFGLNRLLIEKGIVISYTILTELGQNAIFSQISAALSTFSKDMFDKVMQRTINKVYNTKDLVDFISVSQRAIKFHGLVKKYGKINYKDYFKV